jgi:predicted HNH restriction endonuclease
LRDFVFNREFLFVKIAVMGERNCLILTQYRKGSGYKDFIGKHYHFPATKKKTYLKQFSSTPIEIIYFEPQKGGEGVFFGHGKIEKPPFRDPQQLDHYFVEISDYEPFSASVSFKDERGRILERIFNNEHYNAQNAVRKITPALLDELCFRGGIQTGFKSDNNFIRVLNDTLIANELDIDEDFSEGQVLTRLHKIRERNPALTKKKKQKVLSETGRLECEVCSFDFHKIYGKLGKGYAECHHTTPLSTLNRESKTKLADLSIVCANCHRMIHRSRNWVSIEELKNMILPGK